MLWALAMDVENVNPEASFILDHSFFDGCFIGVPLNDVDNQYYVHDHGQTDASGHEASCVLALILSA